MILRTIQSQRRLGWRNSSILFALVVTIAILAVLAVFATTASAGVPAKLSIQTQAAAGSTPSSAPVGCIRNWTVPGSPNPGSSNQLIGVAATSPSDVWAVGNTYTATNSYPLIEHWNGSAWNVVAPTEVLTGSTLYDVVTIAVDNAWAVGDIYNNGVHHSLILHWNGSVWDRVSNPGEVDGYGLGGITAISANDIWVVGTKSTPNEALTMHWDGSVWTIIAASGVNSIDRVAAISTNDVWAAGEGGSGTVMVHWDGAQWNLSPGSFQGLPFGVTATATNDVWAVSTDYSSPTWHAYILHWDGTAWTLVSTDDSKKLLGITATSASDVWAVGTDGVGTFVKHWDGTTWSIVPPPNPNPPQGIFLDAVAISTNELWAVGRQNNDNDTLTARYAYDCLTPTLTPTVLWTGTATRSPIPTLSPTPDCQLDWHVAATPGLGVFQAISFISPSDIWAVGSNGDQTLTEHWDGTQWSNVPSPNPRPGYDYLFGIAAISSTDVWAVGYGDAYSLVEHWDGTQWSVVQSPNVGSGTNHLYSVAAISPNNVWAVGVGVGVLVKHWDGTQWSVVPAPNVGSNNELYGVASVAANDVWAVGYYINSSGYHTLVEHWDGIQWSIVSSPDGSTSLNILNAVTALSTNDVWAVGYQGYEGCQSGCQTLTLHWNGTNWAVVPSPNVGFSSFIFDAVALSSNDVWAVGYYETNGGGSSPLIEHWDGTQWQMVSGPSVTSYTYLYAVAGTTSDNVWAAGFYEDTQQNHTLVERYYNPCVTLTPTLTSTRTSTPTQTPPNTYTATPISTNAPSNTPMSTNTSVTHTATPVLTNTSSPVPTQTPGGPTVTPPTATETPTACTLSFEDVPVGSTFYPFIECLACRGIINGYPCDGPGEPCNHTNDPYFRPGNSVTRGQFAKIAANSAGFNEPPGAQQYEDVLPSSTFYDFIWRLSNRGYINGYPCGGTGESCGPNNLPYFRPNANISRGQIAKIDANAAGYDETPGAQQYEDVLPSSTFFDFIWRLSNRGYINGYPCGGTGEPCGPNNLPYFRPSVNATRGQASKIVANTFFPSCQTRMTR